MKLLKKATALLTTAALAAGLFAGCGSSGTPAPSGAPDASEPSQAATESASAKAPADGEKTLNIFTWDGYFPDDVIAGFEAESGVRVNFSNFESNEEMLTKLQAAGAGDYDVIVVSDYMVDTMRKLGGLLGELDKAKIPNYANIDAGYQSKFYDPDNLYTIPYGPGSPVIVYDPAACKVDIQGYEDLWNPELKDSVVLMDSFRVIIGITLKTLDKSFNETDPAVLEQAKEKLFALAPNIRTLSVNNLQNVILSGEASAGFLFTSQAVLALQENPDLKIVYPKEGLGLGIDTLVTAANAPHKDNAFAFLNYILDPEVSAKIYPQIGYSCPNTAALDLLPEDFRTNPALVIPTELLQNAEFVEDVGDATEAFDKIWTEFKQKLSA